MRPVVASARRARARPSRNSWPAAHLRAPRRSLAAPPRGGAGGGGRSGRRGPQRLNKLDLEGDIDHFGPVPLANRRRLRGRRRGSLLYRIRPLKPRSRAGWPRALLGAARSGSLPLLRSSHRSADRPGGLQPSRDAGGLGFPSEVFGGDLRPGGGDR